MIRLRPLRPREKRNLRHWAMEFAIVVIGVLVALWAQEWVEGTREDRRLAELEEAMREELRYNYLVWKGHETFAQCHRDFSRQLRERLIASEGRWRGYETDFYALDEEDPGFALGIVGVQTHPVSLAAWENARDSGLLARMPADKVEQYRQLYDDMAFIGDAIETVEETRNRLSGLIYPGPLGADTRTEALRDLVIFNNGLRRRTWARGDLPQKMAAAGIGSDEAFSARFGEMVGNFADLQAEQPCVVLPENDLPAEEPRR